MGIQKTVISTMTDRGIDVMGLNILAWKYPDPNIIDGSLLTVESNHFCVLKSRGAVLDVYETGQYSISTPNKPILGSFTQAFFSGQSPWQYEPIYIQRSKLRVQNIGIATSKEMAEMNYIVDYYVHIDNKDDALKLITHMPFIKDCIPTEELANYAGPVIEQAINQIVQLTPMEQINEHIHDIVELARNHLEEFLSVYGIHLNDLKVLITPKDERMRELISLRAFGLSEKDAVNAYVALKMADRGLMSAPNALIGQPFNIGGQVISNLGSQVSQPNSKG